MSSLWGHVNRGTKKFLVSTGLPPSHFLDSFSHLLKLAAFIRSEKLREVATFEDRAELHAYVNSSVVNHEAVDYLEFGVYKGESIRMWTTLNSNPGSRFFG